MADKEWNKNVDPSISPYPTSLWLCYNINKPTQINELFIATLCKLCNRVLEPWWELWSTVNFWGITPYYISCVFFWDDCVNVCVCVCLHSAGLKSSLMCSFWWRISLCAATIESPFFLLLASEFTKKKEKNILYSCVKVLPVISWVNIATLLTNTQRRSMQKYT